MELLTRNAVVRAKHAEVEGVRYVIAPMTLIVPGVLAGSQGALYYPASEIAKNYRQWEGVPVVVNHPTDPLTGINQSAYDDGVQERSGVGVLKNVRIGRGGKLQADGWIDVAKAAQVDPVIIGNILNGVPVELSTGLFTTNLPAEPGAACPRTGKPYQAIATDYRPDHLAVLSNGVPGACSLKDGCGVLVNKAFPTSPRVSPTTPTSSQAETSALPLHTSSPQGDRVGGLVGDSPSLNVFCATGQGGGVDPSCKKGESRQVPPEHPNPASRTAARISNGLLRQASALRHYPHEEAAELAAYAADEAEQAAQAGNLSRARELHNTATLRHEDAATALRGSRRGKAAQQAIEDHLQAAQVHREAANEALYGRDQVGQSVRVLRTDSGQRSQEALAASRGLNKAAQVLAQEAAVASDRAQDSNDPQEAAELHREASRLHGRASDQHGLAYDHHRDAGQREEAARELQAAMTHTTARRWHGGAADMLRSLTRTGHVSNIFCATGVGGGVDPSCKKGESRQAEPPESGSSQAKRASDRAHEATSRLRVREHRLAAAMDSSTTAAQTSAQAAHARDPELHHAAAWHHSGAYETLVEAAPHYAQYPAESRALEEAAQAHIEAARYHRGARDELQHGGRDGHNRAVQRQREQAAEASQAALRETMAAPAETNYAQEARRLAEEAAVASDRAYDEREPTAAYEAHRAAYKAHDLAREAHYLATGQTASDRESWEAHRRAMRAHNTAADAHGETWQALRRLAYLGHVANVFCKTGKDGGVDPTCKKDGSASGKGGAKTDPDKKPTPAADTSPRKSRTESAESALAGTLSDKGYDVLRPLNTKRDVRELARQAQAAARKASSATNPEAARAYHLSAADYHNKVMSKLLFKSLFGKKSDAAWVVHSQARQAHLKAAVASGPSKAVAEQALQQRQLAQELTLAAQAPSKKAGGRASASADQAAILAGRALYEVDSGEAASLHARAAGAHRTAAADHTTRANQSHSKEEKKEHAEAARLHTQARETHTTAAYQLRALKKQGHVTNVFCATGEGGGVDPSCKKGESRQTPPDLPGTAAVLKRSRDALQVAEETTTRTPALEAAFTRAREAVRFAEQADKATTAEEAAKLHEDARQAHQDSSRLFYQQGQAQAGDWQRWSAGAHRQAAREAEQGRGTVMRDVRRQREFAQEASQRALAAGRGLGGGPVTDREQEAAVRSDMAFDEEDPVRATELHRQAGHLHEQVAYSRWRDARRAADEGEAIEERLRRSYEAHDLAREAHAEAAAELERLIDTGHVSNVFCPTGQGGGVDPSCKRGEGRQAPPDKTEYAVTRAKSAARESRTAAGAAMSSGYQAVGTYADRARAHAREAERLTEAGDLEGAKRAHLEAGEAHDEVVRTIGFTHNPPLREVARLNQDAGAQHREIVLELEKGIGAAERELQEDRDVAAHRTAHALERSRAIPPGFDNSARAIAEEAAVASDEATDEREINRAVELHRRAAELHRRAVVAHQGPVIDNDEYNHLHDRAASTHAAAAEWHEAASRNLARAARRGHTLNTFCATGENGLKQKAKRATRAAFKALTFSPESTSKVASRAAEEAAATHTRAGYVQAVYHHLRAAQKFENPPGDWLGDDADRAKYAELAERHRQAAEHYKRKVLVRGKTTNVFCATGEGGGVDPSCGKGGGSKAGVGRGQTRQSDPPAHHGSTLAADASGKATWITQRSANSQAKDLARTAGQHALLAAEHARAGRTNEAVAHHQTASNTHQAVVGALKRKQVLGEEDMHKAHAQAALAHDAAASELKQGRGAVADDVRKHRDSAGAATARAFEASNKSGGKYDRRPIEDAAVLSDQASEERHPETAARLHHQAGAAHGVAAEVHAKAGHREAAAAHRAASEEHRTVARRLHGLHMTGHVANVFCATGEGGGIDPSCKRDGSSGSRGEAVREAPPDHPHTASVEAGKHSDAAYEATRGLTGLQAVKRHASAARNAARRAAEATDPEDAGNNHLNAADAHDRAAFGLELSYASGAAAARRIHAEAASAHRTAASELKLGREELARRVRGYREHAGKSSGTALESSQKAGGPAVALAEEAAVASDLAQDETDPKRAAELHRDAAVLHSRAADAHQQAAPEAHDRGDRLQAEAMWVHRRAYANHLEVAESLRQLARIGHTINARGTPNTNVFCATGQGGGVDPSCKKSDAAGTASRRGKGVSRQAPPPDPAGDVGALTQSLLHATLAVPHRAAHSPVGRAARAAQDAAVASDRAQDAPNGVTAARAHSEAAEFHTEAHTLLYRSGNPARGGFYSSKDRRDKVALAMRHADAAEAHLAMKALRLGDDTLGGRVLNEPESAYSWEVRTLQRWGPTPTHGRPTLVGDVYAFHRILRVTGYPDTLSLPGALDYRQYDTPAEARAAAMDAKTRLRRILIESTGRMG